MSAFYAFGSGMLEQSLENKRAAAERKFELAKMITKSLVWTGYDECHADEKVIERLVSDFIKNLKH